MNLTLSLTAVVQWLHILAGMTWLGTHIFHDFVLWPALLRRPAAEARATFESVEISVRPLSIGSSMAVMLLGIARGTLLGPIRSLETVFTTPYGLTWLAALALVITLTVWSVRWYRALPAKVWDERQVRPDARQTIRGGTIFSTAILGAILACMVLMRFGL